MSDVTSLTKLIQEFTDDQKRDLIVGSISTLGSRRYFNSKGSSSVEQIRIAINNLDATSRMNFENLVAKEIECRSLSVELQRLELINLYDLAARLKSISCAEVISRQLLASLSRESSEILKDVISKSFRAFFTLSRLDSQFVIFYKAIIDKPDYEELKIAAFWSLCFCRTGEMYSLIDKYLINCIESGMNTDDWMRFLIENGLCYDIFDDIRKNTLPKTANFLETKVRNSRCCFVDADGAAGCAKDILFTMGQTSVTIETDLFEKSRKDSLKMISSDVLDQISAIQG